MEYRITHSTTYTYSDPVPVSHNEVRLKPLDRGRQECLDFRMLISPEPTAIQNRFDFFGNHVTYFCIQQPHPGMTVKTTSRVVVRPREPSQDDFPPWETLCAAVAEYESPVGLAILQFAFPSPRIPRVPALAEYARPSFPPGRTILEGAVDLTSRIHRDFEYDPRATTVSTPVERVLQQRRGVCQDFAQLQIGCLRALGLPAAYVSGYLRTIPPPGKPRLVGADASHAWVSVYCGPDQGWIDLDPTNDSMTNTDHVVLARGRDYSDVTPIRGVFLGGTSHTLRVSVDVEPLPANVG
jgi:transglutaminase-like putative cysteine protease